MKVLHLDSNHPVLEEGLEALGCENITDYTSDKGEIEDKLEHFQGIVLRSRFKIDKSFLDRGRHLKFIARVGSGLENIDVDHAERLGIKVFSAPEGNSNAVAEHALAMLLALTNRILIADAEVRKGLWRREANRGIEIDGKTVALIGYGNNGKAFARKLSGFDVRVLFYDILTGLEDEYAAQCDMEKIYKEADILSLHMPETDETIGLIDAEYISRFEKPFWLINTARGKHVVTEDLVQALESGHILGAGLDVLEYEKSSFENLFEYDRLPAAFKYLVESDRVVLSPHIAGWTVESKEKLALVLVEKIRKAFF